MADPTPEGTEAQAAEHPEQKLEQTGLPQRRLDARAGIAELGQQPRQFAAAAPNSLTSSGSLRSRTTARRAATTGAYGSSASARSTHSPTSTSVPSSAARRANSLTKRLFPIPASPTTSAAPPSPSPARRSSPSNSPSG